MHAAWQLHPSAMRLREEITKWRTDSCRRVLQRTQDYVCGTAALRNARRKASGVDRSGTVVQQQRMASQAVRAAMSCTRGET